MCGTRAALLGLVLLASCHLLLPFPPEQRPVDRGPDADTVRDIAAGDHVSADGPRSDGTSRDRSPADRASADSAVPPPTVTFAQRYGGTDLDAPYAACVDSAGRLFLTGYFKTTINFGGGVMATAGAHDLFIASLEPSGAEHLARRFGGSGSEIGEGIAVDAAGNIYVTGQISSAVSMGGVSLPYHGGATDIVVASYDSSGGHRWSKSFGSSAGDLGTKIAVDNGGNVYVVGFVAGPVDFGGGPVPFSGGNDGFLLALTSGGDYRWATSFGGGTSYDRADGVGASSQGDVFVTGSSSGDINLGGGTLLAKGFTDMFLASYSSGGVHRWSSLLGGAAAKAAGLGLAVNGKDVVVTGSFSQSVDLGGGPVTAKGRTDVLLASYDGASGAYRWARTFGSSGSGSAVDDDTGEAVAVDAAGNIYVTGGFYETIDAGGGPITAAGVTDVFVASYAAGGAFRWSLGLGGSGTDYGKAVAVDASGSVWLAGFFAGTAHFDNQPSLLSAGSWDIFVVKLTP
jgi:hypothetical protein